MATFKYTLPSGSKFTVEMPEGTTQAEADKVFYSQVAAGTFVGYRTGDQLTHPEEAIINFGLSRLQRGTAGVDDSASTVIGTLTGSPVVAADLITTIQNLPSVAAIPNLDAVPVENPVTPADVITVDPGLGPLPVGNMSAAEVKTMMAAVVVQPYYVITQAKGIGKFGFSAPQLERVGYLKPGTTERYLGGFANNTFSNPANFVTIMQTPSVWTGKNGIVSLDALLANESIQNRIYREIMQQSYDTLVAVGVIVPNNVEATSPYVGPGQVYTPYQTLVTADAVTLLATPASNINVSPSVATQVPGGDISALVNGAVTETNTASQSVINSVNNVNNVINSVNSDIAALVGTANKYGPAVATAWSKASGLANGTISSTALLSGAKGQAEALVGNIKGQAGAIAGNVKGQAEALVAQGKQAIDNIAKSAKSAMDFAQTKLSSLVTGVKKAAAYTNTVNRTTVDAAVTRVIGSAKITPPTFEVPNLDSLGVTKDIAAAQAQLASLQSQGSAILNQGQAIVRQAQGTINGVQTTAQNIATNAQSQIRGITRV